MPADPSGLTGKLLWLRAKDLGTGSISSWADQSGSGKAATPTGTAPTVATASTPSGGKSVAFAGNGYFPFPAIIAPHTFAASGDAGATYAAAKAFDGTATTCWAVVSTSGWLRIAPTGIPAVTSYTISPYTGDAPSQAPRTWTFEGSMDASSWTTLDTRSGVTFAAATPQTFTFANSTVYTYYRLNVTANNGNAVLSVGELLLNGTTMSGPSEAEMWVVVKANSGNQGAPVHLSDSGEDDYYPFGGVVYDNFGGSRRSFTPTVPLTSWRIFRARLTTSGRTWYLDNASQLSVGSSAVGWSATARIGAGLTSANSPTYFGGNVAEVLVVNHALSSSEEADLIAYFNAEHGLTVPGGSTGGGVTGSVAGTLPALTGSASGAVATSTTGTVAGTLPALTGSATGDSITTGASDGTLPALTGSVLADVAGVIGGVIAGTLPALGGSVSAEVTPPVTGTVAGTLPSLTGRVNGAGAEDMLVARSVTETSSHAAAPFTADRISAHSVTEVSSSLAAPHEVEYLSAHSVTEVSSTAVPELRLVLDPETHLPQFRLIVVDRQGTPLGELGGAQLGDATYGLGGQLSFSFTIRKNHPRANLLGVGAEVQVWSGAEPIRESWFVIVEDPTDGGATLSFRCEGLRWHLGNVVIGKDRPELIKNGGFEQGLKHWHPTWLAGSAAEAPPTSQIVTGALALSGGKALRTTAVEKVFIKEVQTAAIFHGNRPYASEPLAAGYLPGGEQIIRDQVKNFAKGAAITVEGFTADVDAGNGLALSQRRALAAKATIHAFRPDLVVTAIGRGESVQVAPNNTPANQAKNRRIVITGMATRIGHRQCHQQFFRFRNDTRAPIDLELALGINLIDYGGPSKDGWGAYINRRAASAPKKIVDEAHSDIDPIFPKQRWTWDGTTITAPANSNDLYEVRLYGTAGDTIFDEVSCKPNLLTAFYNVTRPMLYKGLVEHAQDPAFGKVDLNITTNCPSFGTRDDYEYEWKQHRVVNDALEEQLRADDSPDFAIVTTATRRIATAWMRRGRRSPVHFELGGVVASYEDGVDGDRVATTGIVTSSHDGGATAEARVKGPLVRGLVMERVMATEKNRPSPRLTQLGKAMVRYGRADVLTSVTCKPSKTQMLLGKVWVGDVAPFTVRDGQVDVEGDYRIVEVRLSFATRSLTYELTPEV
ncbi:MAG TPA: discoidin domain-containing protein [Phytomonospora sp.]